MEGGEQPSIPVRTDFDHEIIFDADEFCILAQKFSKDKAIHVRWDTVTKSTAYKRDLWTTDQVCIGFELSDGAFVELHQEMKGWSDFCSAMPAHLPGAKPWHEWYMKITDPPFAPNPTLLFERDSSGDAMTVT